MRGKDNSVSASAQLCNAVLKNGGDVFTLQHLMGHADLRMTRRYAELDEAFVEQQHKSFSPVVLLEQAKSNRVRRI